MIEETDFETFLYISTNKYQIIIFDKKNKIIFKKITNRVFLLVKPNSLINKTKFAITKQYKF